MLSSLGRPEFAESTMLAVKVRLAQCPGNRGEAISHAPKVRGLPDLEHV